MLCLMPAQIVLQNFTTKKKMLDGVPDFVVGG